MAGRSSSNLISVPESVTARLIFLVIVSASSSKKIEPAGFSSVPVQPAAAFYSNDLHEFILPYDAVRQAESPDGV